MGYRSQVAFTVVFVDQAGRDKVLDSLDEDTRKFVLEQVTLTETAVRFHEDSIKWYSTKSMGGILDGYEEINALETFLDAACNANDELEFGDESEGVPSVGAFVRVGEEDDDNDTRYWGYSHDSSVGLPEPWDLVRFYRSIEIGWNEEAR